MHLSFLQIVKETFQELWPSFIYFQIIPELSLSENYGPVAVTDIPRGHQKLLKMALFSEILSVIFIHDLRICMIWMYLYDCFEKPREFQLALDTTDLFRLLPRYESVKKMDAWCRYCSRVHYCSELSGFIYIYMCIYNTLIDII